MAVLLVVVGVSTTGRPNLIGGLMLTISDIGSLIGLDLPRSVVSEHHVPCLAILSTLTPPYHSSDSGFLPLTIHLIQACAVG